MTKVALIWGVAGGVGRALGSKLKEAGWQVIGIGRQGGRCPAWLITRICRGCGRPVCSATARVLAAVQRKPERHPVVHLRLDDIKAERVETMTPATFRRIMDANLLGAYNAVPQSASAGLGTPLVFLGAVSERMRLPGLSAYAAAKAGLEAFADALRKEERKRQVIVVRPGAMNTGFWRKVPFKMPGSALDPEIVAAQIIEAVDAGHQGALDL